MSRAPANGVGAWVLPQQGDAQIRSEVVVPVDGPEDLGFLRLLQELGWRKEDNFSGVIQESGEPVIAAGREESPCQDAGWDFLGVGRWSSSVAGALCEIAEDVSALLPVRLPLLRGALGELSEDVAPHAVPLVAVLCHVTVGGPAATVVVSSGMALPAWAQVHALTALFLGGGAYIMLDRMPLKPDRRTQRFAAAALGTSAVVHAFQACGGLSFFLPDLAAQLCTPSVVTHFVGDYVSLPLMLTAYAHLAGRDMSQLLPVVALSTLGVTGFVVSGVVDDSVHALGSALLGAVSMYKASQVLNGVLPRSPDMQRLYTSQDLFIFGWLLLIGARCLACGGEISDLTEDKVIVFVDILSKLGVCHLALKPPLLA